MKRRDLLIFAIVVTLPWFFRAPASAEKPLVACVSVLPQKYFVERIAGNRAEVMVMVEPGAVPHTYEPTPRQMAALSKAAVYFSIGVPFEDAWLPKIRKTHPSLSVVPTDAGIAKLPMRDAYDQRHAGDGSAESRGEDHEHGVLDPHIWLSPPLVMLQARHILTGLLAVDPDGTAEYEANYKRFIVELVDLDGEIRSLLRKRNGNRFLVFHPAWGYFADAYGLEQISVEVEGKEPKASQLQDLIRGSREAGFPVIFVQPQFSARSAEVVAKAVGARLVEADPLAADWAENLRRFAIELQAALK